MLIRVNIILCTVLSVQVVLGTLYHKEEVFERVFLKCTVVFNGLHKHVCTVCTVCTVLCGMYGRYIHTVECRT